MGTNGEVVRSDAGGGCPAVRWQRIWSHREQLLKVARRRSASVEDAEDAVHEAMVRAVECANVDDDRLGAWLTSVTVRLCVDRFRQVNREAQVHTRWVRAIPGEVTVEEAVCDRAEAAWLAGCSGDLPQRQVEALGLQAEGLDLSEIARGMGLSYRAVQSLLARARRTLRAALAGALAVVVFVWRGRPRMAVGTTHTVALVSAAVSLAIGGLTLTSPTEAEARKGPARRLSPDEGYLRAHAPVVLESPAGPFKPRASGRSARPENAGTLIGARDVGETPTADEPGLPNPGPTETPDPQGSVVPKLPPLPQVPGPAVPVVPDVPMPAVPDVPMPDLSALAVSTAPVHRVQSAQPAAALDAISGTRTMEATPPQGAG